MIRIWFILASSSIRLSVEEWKVRNMSGTNATLHVGRLIIKFVSRGWTKSKEVLTCFGGFFFFFLKVY
jgi:hypothetical protein